MLEMFKGIPPTGSGGSNNINSADKKDVKKQL
jgi:hypothetical protein